MGEVESLEATYRGAAGGRAGCRGEEENVIMRATRCGGDWGRAGHEAERVSGGR